MTLISLEYYNMSQMKQFQGIEMFRRGKPINRRQLTHCVMAIVWTLMTAAPGTAIEPTVPPRDEEKKSAFVTGPGGVSIYTEEFGRRDGPAIVLVHGVMRDHNTWSLQRESSLAERYRLVAFDLRGHGKSERPSVPASYSGAEVWAGDLKAVLDHYGLERPILLGWSFGGRVVLDYLQLHGDGGIAGVVLVSTRLGARRRDSRRGAGRGDSQAAPRWVGEAVLAGAGRDLTAALEKAEVPVLIVHGARDPVVPPSSADYSAAHARNGTKIILPGAGHTPHQEAGGEFNRLLLEFADRVYGRGR